MNASPYVFRLFCFLGIIFSFIIAPIYDMFYMYFFGPIAILILYVFVEFYYTSKD